MKKNLTILFSLLAFATNTFAQEIILHGYIFSEENSPVSAVNVSYGKKGVSSDEEGHFLLKVDKNLKSADLKFSHVSYKSKTVSVDLNTNTDTIRKDIILSLNSSQLSNIDLVARKNTLKELSEIEAQNASIISTAGDGIISILKTLPGVSANNELSSQYMVRGGNFDENLIYVNGIEIYKPQLMRSGQQEGLSFVNSNMVESINFYAGGFKSSYGDRMSSVLDIKYRTPKEFKTTIEGSLLGASISSDLVSKDKKLSSIIGFRYKNIALINQTRDTEANFTPNYTDFQTLINYNINDKYKLNILGNLSLNRYNYIPVSRVTNFGTFNKPLQLRVFYDGNEVNKYLSWTLGSNFNIQHNENFYSDINISAYHSKESEYFDILGQYLLSELNNDLGSDDFGNPISSVGIGSELKHARNELDLLVVSAKITNTHQVENSIIKYGAQYSRESIYDRLDEWIYLDSADYSLPHNSDEPYMVYDDDLELFQNAKAYNELNSNRIQVFFQYENSTYISNVEINYNLGIRANYWDVNNQLIISPRFIVDIKDTRKPEIAYWISVGKYSQAPFYRELRAFNGELNKDVVAQDSWHYLLGNRYDFKIWNRDFRLSSELYYKKINRLNPYNIENIQLRYSANNNAEAYVAGADFRINGEFVPGVESWLSMGLMSAKQNIDNRGYIPLPTDQRFKFAIFFQDYLPKFPTFKVNINLLYYTGLPGGSPNNSDQYKYQLRLPDYKRLDIGFTKVIADKENNIVSRVFPDIKYASITLEALNIADIANTISYSWVRDIYSEGMYAVPNKLTGRFWNLKLNVSF